MTATEALARQRAQRLERDRRVFELKERAATRLATVAAPPSLARHFVHWWGRGKRTVFYWTDRRAGSWRWRKVLQAELAADVDEVREYRERMLDEIRPGVFAEWSDLLERWT